MADIFEFADERIKAIKRFKKANALDGIVITDNIETYFGRTYYRVYIYFKLNGGHYDIPSYEYVGFGLRNSHMKDLGELEKVKVDALKLLLRFYEKLHKSFNDKDELNSVLSIIEEKVSENETTYEDRMPYHASAW
jgi:hypothetical protein